MTAAFLRRLRLLRTRARIAQLTCLLGSLGQEERDIDETIAHLEAQRATVHMEQRRILREREWMLVSCANLELDEAASRAR